ncbi:hypothetical protein BRADI_2g10656v3 [Brachypodium distachyon]|uniref:Uncharacterized protein n=1 Tax=Brachypodium distachyon TaxID=15368 RepID=A0A0Q3FZW4_BRADI|nr:hypothetical protein BRADI_2g10656v3 [Brachypodium distachyon]
MDLGFWMPRFACKQTIPPPAKIYGRPVAAALLACTRRHPEDWIRRRRCLLRARAFLLGFYLHRYATDLLLLTEPPPWSQPSSSPVLGATAKTPAKLPAPAPPETPPESSTMAAVKIPSKSASRACVSQACENSDPNILVSPPLPTSKSKTPTTNSARKKRCTPTPPGRSEADVAELEGSSKVRAIRSRVMAKALNSVPNFGAGHIKHLVHAFESPLSISGVTSDTDRAGEETRALLGLQPWKDESDFGVPSDFPDIEPSRRCTSPDGNSNRSSWDSRTSAGERRS